MGGMTSLVWPEARAVATPERVAAYAALTDDFNPIHVDPDFAATTNFGGCIAHGTMTLALVWDLAEAALGSDRLEGAAIDVKFVAPVLVGAEVIASGSTSAPGEHRLVVRLADGRAVLEATIQEAAE